MDRKLRRRPDSAPTADACPIAAIAARRAAFGLARARIRGAALPRREGDTHAWETVTVPEGESAWIHFDGGSSTRVVPGPALIRYCPRCSLSCEDMMELSPWNLDCDEVIVRGIMDR